MFECFQRYFNNQENEEAEKNQNKLNEDKEWLEQKIDYFFYQMEEANKKLNPIVTCKQGHSIFENIEWPEA